MADPWSQIDRIPFKTSLMWAGTVAEIQEFAVLIVKLHVAKFRRLMLDGNYWYVVLMLGSNQRLPSVLEGHEEREIIRPMSVDRCGKVVWAEHDKIVVQENAHGNRDAHVSI
jgi:hypothetical protein